MRGRASAAVVLDIDGCLLPPELEPVSWADLESVRSLLFSRDRVPVPILCTGRAQPYVEAVSKFFGATAPAVCEWGGVIYTPAPYQIEPHPDLDREVVRVIGRLVADMTAAGYNVQPKMTALTVYVDSKRSVPEIELAVIQRTDELGLTDSLSIRVASNRVDASPRGIDKGIGLRTLLERLDIDPQASIAIGDDPSDLPAMQLVGTRAAPANADALVQRVCSYVSPYPYTAGVADILALHLRQSVA